MPGVTRRHAVAALAAPLLAAQTPPTRVIDVAAHFYDTARPQGVPWPRPADTVLYQPSLPPRFLKAIAPHHVDGVVAIEASPWLEDNLWLLMLADREPLIKAVVGNLTPGHPDFRPALLRFAKHPLFRGIRLNAASLEGIMADPAKSPDLGLLAERSLSLDILINNAAQFATIARLAERFLALPLIVGHLPLDDTSGMEALGRYSSVCVKVSGVVRKVNGEVPREAAYYRKGLDQLWNTFGPDRLLFASNWPTCDLIAHWPVVYGVVADYMATRPRAESEMFFWQNATRVYKLV